MERKNAEKTFERLTALRAALPEKHRRKVAFETTFGQIVNIRTDEANAIPREIAEVAAAKAGLKFFEKRKDCIAFVQVHQYFAIA